MSVVFLPVPWDPAVDLFVPERPVVETCHGGVRLALAYKHQPSLPAQHYQHQVERIRGEGQETLAFGDAIEAEEERLRGEVNKMLQDERYSSPRHRHYSYLTRGIYIDQLLVWSRFFDRDQMLVLRSEDLFSNPPHSLEATLSFLGLSRWVPATYPPTYKLDYVDMHPANRRRLQDYFEPHNQRLYEFLETDFGW